jgi:hypothetical protein
LGENIFPEINLLSIKKSIKMKKTILIGAAVLLVTGAVFAVSYFCGSDCPLCNGGQCPAQGVCCKK